MAGPHPLAHPRRRCLGHAGRRTHRAGAALGALALVGFAFAARAFAQDQPSASVEPLTDEAFALFESFGEAPDGAAAQARAVELFREYTGQLDSACLSRDAAQACGWLAIELSLSPPSWRDSDLTPIALLEHGADVLLSHDLIQSAARAEAALGKEMCVAGRAAQARQRLEQRLPRLEADPRLLPEVLVQLGECARLTGDFPAAEAYLARAERELAPPLDVRGVDQPLMELTAANLAFTLAIDLGLPDHAARPLALASELIAKLETEFGLQLEAELWRPLHELHRAQFAAAIDDHGSAIERLRTLLLQPPGALLPSLRASCRQLLGRALSELAYTRAELEDEAATELEGALGEAALSGPECWETELALADVERRRGNFARASELIDSVRWRLARAGDVSSSYGVATLEAVAAELVLAQPSERDRLAPQLVALGSAYDAFLAEWSSVPKRRDGVAFLHFSSRQAVVATLVRLTLEVDGRQLGAERALAQLLRAQTLGSLSRALGGEPVLLDEARRELCGPRRGVLIYLPGPERSFVFACDAARVTCSELAASATWNEPRSEWFALLSRSPRKDTADRGQRLAQHGGALADALLPDDVRMRLAEWDEVSIVGIDLLGYVPFEPLPLEAQATFGQRYATAYLPSLAVGCQLARRANVSPLPEPSLAVFAAPTEPAGSSERFHWTTIVWDGSHEQALRETYGAGHLRTWVADDASLDALRDAQGFAAVQIVAHGFYEPERQPPPGLALAPSTSSDGWVRCADIEKLALAPLVALGVCGAGRGTLRFGDDGVTNLGGACFKAGARCVVLSPVDLEQTATEALLASFHREFARGTSPARAMLAARRELAANPRYADPYYHSTLQVVGLGQRAFVQPNATASAESTTHARSFAGIAAAMAICLAGAFFVARALARRRVQD